MGNVTKDEALYQEMCRVVAEQVIDHTREDKNGRRVNLHPVVDLSRHRGQFRNVHDKRQRRILQQADKNPHQRRQNISQRLRQQHAPQRLLRTEPLRKRGLILARRQGSQSG